MKQFISNLLKMRKGKLVCITVYDEFTGFVKILKNRFWKWYIEIVDVSMCYKSQKQLVPGERLWITSNELYRDKQSYLRLKSSIKESYTYEDLPF